MHHDAPELPNGQIVFLTGLCEGQAVTVIQLPARNAQEVVVSDKLIERTASPAA